MMQSKWSLLSGPLLASLLAASCAPAETTTAGSQALACEQLGKVISADRIGLPSSGARVEAALPVPASDAAPAHCLVRGAIGPVDPTAPDIKFHVALPENWNGRALMLGGGGFDGVVPDVIGPIFAQPVDVVQTPLAKGYAVFGSDSGHQSVPGAAPVPTVDASFAVNDEALANFAGDALKKTRDAAIFLISQRYGSEPKRTFFAGGSNGGREGLVVIQKWPSDFDGAVIYYPFWSAGSTALTFGSVMAAFTRDGAYLGPDQQAFLYEALIKACDTLDGASDGLISNIDACEFNVASLACGSGAAKDACLTPPQIAALQKYEGGAAFRYRSGRGETSHPGFPALAGADLRGAQQLASTPPTYPPHNDMPTIAHFYDQFMRYAVARDPQMNPWTVDPEAPGQFAERINTVVDLLDYKPDDLAAFRARGGRLLLLHGLADPIVSSRTTDDLWQRLKAFMGAEERRKFARYYTVPGYGHGRGGSNAFEPAWDTLSLLESWVERDTPPDAPSIADSKPGNALRTRPLCEAGMWPRYVGGSLDDASSFVCQGQPR